MASDGRQQMIERQLALARCLTSGAEPPAEFDVAKLRLAAESLSRKRARSVRLAWPQLTQALGPQFESVFAEYAASAFRPTHGGSLADGRRFAAHLARIGQLPEEGQMEAFFVDLRWRHCSGGLKPRRGPALRIARFHKRLILAVRLPWLGVWWWSR